MISKILLPLDIYTLIEQNIFFPWMSYFSTFCDLNSHIVSGRRGVSHKFLFFDFIALTEAFKHVHVDGNH